MSVCTTSGLRSSEPLNRQRLFVVCPKGASEEMLARLFRTWPGLEYLDLKRDRATGEYFCHLTFCQLSADRSCANIGGCVTTGSTVAQGTKVHHSLHAMQSMRLLWTIS